MKEKEVRDFVRSQREGEVYGCYGPSVVDNLEVWEAWVTESGQFQSRFVAATNGRSPKYFSQFQQFCAYIDRQQTAAKTLNKNLEEQLAKQKHEHVYKLVSLTVATISFLACIGTFIFLVINKVEAGYNYLALLGGLLASGSTMFFGTWRMPLNSQRKKV